MIVREASREKIADYQRMEDTFPQSLEPQVLALDEDESRELTKILAPKQSNTSFIKGLSKVKSKVSTFQSKDQK
jgi:hypothetical protein